MKIRHLHTGFGTGLLLLGLVTGLACTEEFVPPPEETDAGALEVDAGGTPDAGLSGPADGFAADLGRALCARFVRCGALEAAQEADCVAVFSADATQASYRVGTATGRLSYLASEAQKCLDTLKNATCELPHDFKAKECERVFQPAVAVGGACTASHQCREGSCDAQTCGTGKCQALTPLGQSCAGDTCVSAAYCDPVSGLCAARKPAGAACVSGEECLSGLDCVMQKCAAVPPVPLKKEGEPCETMNGEPRCAEGLYCKAKVCAKQLGEGTACVAAEDPCRFLLQCGQTTRACKRVPKVGEPCTDVPTCAPGAYCDLTGLKLCQPLKDNGQPCTLASECRSSSCQSGRCECL